MIMTTAAGAEVGELMLRFPDDADVQKLNDQAKPAAEVADGIDKGGDYARAAQAWRCPLHR